METLLISALISYTGFAIIFLVVIVIIKIDIAPHVPIFDRDTLLYALQMFGVATVVTALSYFGCT